MENGDSLAGVGDFFSGETWENFQLDLHDPVDNNPTVCLQDATPRIGWSFPEANPTCFPWDPVGLSGPPFSFNPSIGADSVQPIHHTEEIYNEHGAGNSTSSATPWLRPHTNRVISYESSQFLAPSQLQYSSTTNSVLDTPESSNTLWDPEPSRQAFETAKSDDPTQKLRPGKNAPLQKEAVALFKSVFSNDYYPDSDQYTRLAQRTGLSAKQVRGWFNNQRHRDKHRSSSAQPLTRRSLKGLESQYKPMDYLVDSVNNLEIPLSGRVSAPPEFNAEHTPYRSSSRTSSVYSGHSSNASNGSGASLSSKKKGVRKHPTKPKQKRHDFHMRPFVCTFGCEGYFRNLSDWRRHEKSKHTQEELWVCNNPVAGYLPTTCPYDLAPFPSADHLELHGHEACVVQSEATRTFTRLDYFHGHLRRIHGVTDPAPIAKIIESWKGAVPLMPPDPALNCGFCGKDFANWDDRVAHVGEHFKQRKQFVDWWPDRKDTTASLTGLLVQQAPIDFDPAQPVNCLSCGALFKSLWIAQKEHDICHLYSCRFLTEVEETSPFALTHGVRCVYCGKLNKGYQKSHFETVHNFRGCKQHIFISEQKFHLHLMDVHSATSTISSELSRRFSKPELKIEPVFAPWPAEFGKCRPWEELHVGVSGDVCDCEFYA